MTVIFIHVVPYNDQTNIIVGYCNEYVDEWILNYVDSWEGLTGKNFETLLTTLFTAHIENWGMSPDLLKEIKKENIILFENYMFNNANNYSPNQNVNFNLFEYDE